jgi:hypothetical protein
MAEQLWGAGTALVLVLAYVLLVQAMTAAVVLLAEFIVLRVRVLRSLLAAVEREAPASSPQAPQGQEPAYRVGGGLMRW